MVMAMGEPAWADDERFATNAGRLANQDELDRQIEAWTCSREDYALMRTLQAAGVPAGVCQTPGDRVERDEQFRARNWWATMPHPEMGEQSEFDGVTPTLSTNPGARTRCRTMPCPRPAARPPHRTSSPRCCVTRTSGPTGWSACRGASTTG